MTEEKLALTTEWDKTFPKSAAVEHEKVTFHNRYGITLAADLYRPLDATTPLPAIAVCGPFGAVKEQCSVLYAQTLAERSFLTIAFDPSYTGESGGEPRYMEAANSGLTIMTLWGILIRYIGPVVILAIFIQVITK